MSLTSRLSHILRPNDYTINRIRGALSKGVLVVRVKGSDARLGDAAHLHRHHIKESRHRSLADAAFDLFRPPGGGRMARRDGKTTSDLMQWLQVSPQRSKTPPRWRLNLRVGEQSETGRSFRVMRLRVARYGWNHFQWKWLWWVNSISLFQAICQMCPYIPLMKPYGKWRRKEVFTNRLPITISHDSSDIKHTFSLALYTEDRSGR